MSVLDSAQAISLRGKQIAHMALNGATIWQASRVNNLLPLATDTDRSTIYGGVGFKESTYLTSVGGPLTQDQYAGLCTTGFIPIKAGDKVRVKGFLENDTAHGIYMVGYNASNRRMNHRSLSAIQGVKAGTYQAPGYFEFTLSASLFTEELDAVRICLKGITTATIITVNEEIP